MKNTLIRTYPFLCITALLFSFLPLFRNGKFVADPEFLFMILPQAASVRFFGLIAPFWNSLTGCGIPFFASPWIRPYSIPNIFFHFYGLRTGYILFLLSSTAMAYFTFYYMVRFFYGGRFIPAFLSILAVSSGMMHGYFTTNYAFIEYYIAVPFMMVLLYLYAHKRRTWHLIAISALSVYLFSSATIIAFAAEMLLLNIFLAFCIFEKEKRFQAIIMPMAIINTLLLCANFFKLAAIGQYYLIESVRSVDPLAPAVFSQAFISSINFLLLSGHFPINLPYAWLFLMLACFFVPSKDIERISLRTTIAVMFAICFAYIALLVAGGDNVKTVALHNFLWVAHLTGTLMLGIGVRAFFMENNRRREIKACVVFIGILVATYLVYAFSKHSFRPDILLNVRWPFILAAAFFVSVFLFKDLKLRKLAAMAIALIFACASIYFRSSNWVTDNSYTASYGNPINREIMGAIGLDGNNINKRMTLDSLFRVMGYRKEGFSVLGLMNEDMPFFAVGNYPLLFKTATIHNHDNVFLKRYYAFCRAVLSECRDGQSVLAADRLFASSLFPLFNVRYIFTYDQIDLPGVLLLRTLADAKTKIYRFDKSLPRIFVVDDCAAYNSIQGFCDIARKKGIDFSKTVMIEGFGNGWKSHSGPLEYTVGPVIYGNDRIALDVNVNKSSFLVLLDNYYPGWKAYINGRETPVHPADGTFRALELPGPGAFHVVFKYRPTFLKAGLVLTGIVFFILSAICIIEIRKNRR